MNTNNTSKTHEGLAQGMTNIYDEVNTSVASAIKQDLLALSLIHISEPTRH